MEKDITQTTQVDVSPWSSTDGFKFLTNSNDVLLIPTPTADPQDPLNLPQWRKFLIVILLSMFSSLGLSLLSGLGALLPYYEPEYIRQGATQFQISALLTYPPLVMGFSNLISMPVAMAIGRRPVFLFSVLLLVVAAFVCAHTNDLPSHLACQLVIAFAAGNSEALVPLMVQESHFVHERSTCLMWQSAVSTIVCTIFMLCASPIAASVGPNNWYTIDASLSLGLLLICLWGVPETRYVRLPQAHGRRKVMEDGNRGEEQIEMAITASNRPVLDYEAFNRRTWRSDLRILTGPVDIRKGIHTIISVFKILLFPDVFWSFCLNGATLGTAVAVTTTYGNVIAGPGFNWPARSISYVTTGQIIVSLISLPLLGYGSDRLIQWSARRNNGIHKPRTRLVPLCIPLAVCVFSTILYGEASTNPQRYNWFVIAWSYSGCFFGFVGANITTITYLLDQHPTRAGPVLIVICAFRGFVAFGFACGVQKLIGLVNYNGAFDIYTGLVVAVGLLGLPVYYFNGYIRRLTER